jgi:hypothetical protein
MEVARRRTSDSGFFAFKDGGLPRKASALLPNKRIYFARNASKKQNRDC